jgi:hypothetical protein
MHRDLAVKRGRIAGRHNSFREAAVRRPLTFGSQTSAVTNRQGQIGRGRFRNTRPATGPAGSPQQAAQFFPMAGSTTVVPSPKWAVTDWRA